jgi:ribose transport system ATP-binding protein
MGEQRRTHPALAGETARASASDPVARAGPPPVLEISGLAKRFFGTLALDHVDLSVGRGEIHALVGENGAGKSTLIKILAGIHPADAGEIRLNGRLVQPHLNALPISFVHQDLGLVDELSVGENVALVTGFPRRGGLIDWGRVWSRTREIYAAMEIEAPDPRALVGTLGAAGRALLGIVRGLARPSEIVVLDEPTAALPEPDAQHLFAVLRTLRVGGKSVIYVTHRLNELFGLADRVTVLRDGRRVRSAAIGAVTPHALVQDMLGREIGISEMAHAAPLRSRTLLAVKGLWIGRRGPVEFALAPGEVVGLVGLRGAGQEMIGRALFGARRPDAGEIRLDGARLLPDEGIPERIGRGIALLAADRGRESAFPGMSVRENILPSPRIAGGAAWRFLSPARERRDVAGRLARFDVRPRDPGALIDWLSGGNQQKVFVGRWLESKARLFIMEEPTAGVDVGAKFAIHGLLRDAARGGAAVLVISSDFEEVAALCDRALVVGRGRIVAELHQEELSVERLITCSSLGLQPAAGA